MSDHDIVRARRQRLIFLMETKPNDPNFHAWKQEYNDLCPKTSAPRNAPTPIEPPRGYPPVLTPENNERRNGQRRESAAIKGIRL